MGSREKIDIEKNSEVGKINWIPEFVKHGICPQRKRNRTFRESYKLYTRIIGGGFGPLIVNLERMASGWCTIHGGRNIKGLTQSR